MADVMNMYPSWPQPCSSKPPPPTSLKITSNPTSPIPIPRRKAVCPPPSSPVRDQRSPELVFNFEFSVSPDAPDATAHLFLQQRGAGVRRFPLHQKLTYAPLSALGTSHDTPAQPYAQEPFLYAVPKLPFHDAQNTHTVYAASDVLAAAANDTKEASATRHRRLTSGSSLSSLSSFQSSEPSCPPSADVSMQIDGDENFPLTSAFQRPLISASVTSTSLSSLDNASFSPSVLYRSPSPSPPRQLRSRTRTRHVGPPRPPALRRTTAAAPVVSLNVAQAECSDRGLSVRGHERSRSPYSGMAQPRKRRSSSVGAEHDVEKLRDPARRMATVVGRGAGRVVSMFEYNKYGSGRSLVSDEDIERSLEKEIQHGADTSGDDGRSVSRHRREERREKGSARGARSPELERGRARGRAPVRGAATATRTRALPGWQWIDA
ncbi:hypothetical protein L226DRAFT_91638 [Lentinus tigrinus ALCF2SS1-7]|uniref:Uncharacterized protein n=1 Tax=Lentinus tigrinus ALCF2SS1-6 TaxID=1328759 RepID=A0A5C2RYP5_9APHY|nr:hypothetical protein L227DRAFT_288527 [Lentinus tigrinus ALCF2SS1-6]RPD73950.1 hypothetical protein L226DRAFT_91638 [Lentinus tigrinus ALCF2SS1-7]